MFFKPVFIPRKTMSREWKKVRRNLVYLTVASSLIGGIYSLRSFVPGYNKREAEQRELAGESSVRETTFSKDPLLGENR